MIPGGARAGDSYVVEEGGVADIECYFCEDWGAAYEGGLGGTIIVDEVTDACVALRIHDEENCGNELFRVPICS